ncbi:MAG TPA: hypothetical protein DCR97_08630 [Deltaproteobacteria bacterium]|jgi:hypothetical protein|nr:hypothetical protein [Deltaproteobacteria bacterium]
MNDVEKKEMDRLNSQALNQKAREMLIRSGEEPRTGCLHCVQLACWALDRGYFSVEDAVSETIRAMTEWRPVRLMNFLSNGGSAEYSPKGWETSRGPEELALTILEDLEARAYLTFPWYGSISD